MQIRTFISVTGVTLALVLPATAGAALAKTGTPAGTGKAKSHQRVARNAVHTKVTVAAHPSTAVGKGTASSTSSAPTVIYAPPVTPVVQTQEQICESSGNGCTAEQYCELWSINCSALSAGDSSPDASATAADPADLLAQDAQALANLELEYCCTADECIGITY